MSRMPQGEVQFVPLHGEDATQAMGHGGQFGGEVGGICGGAHVADEVAAGHHGQSVVHEHGAPEDALEIGFARLLVVAAHGHIVAPQPLLLGNALQLSHRKGVVQKTVFAVPLVHHTTPRGPSPNGERRGEEIVVGHILCHLVHVEAGNHADAGIVFIAVKHLLAEGEETLRGHHVIFKHHHLVRQRECPFVRQVARGVASLVLGAVVAFHTAFPVNLFHNLPAGHNAGHVLRTARPVLVQEKLRGARLSHLFKHFLQRVGPVEEEHQHGNVYLGWMFH